MRQMLERAKKSITQSGMKSLIMLMSIRNRPMTLLTTRVLIKCRIVPEKYRIMLMRCRILLKDCWIVNWSIFKESKLDENTSVKIFDRSANQKAFQVLEKGTER